LRKSVAEVFEDTLNNLLSEALEATLGPNVRDEVYSVFGRRGITKRNVPSQFDDVVSILSDTFGVLGAKVIVYKAIAELHREYSQATDFAFTGTLRDKLLMLYELVVSKHIWPRHMEDADSFFDRESRMGRNDSPDGSIQAGWPGLYRIREESARNLMVHGRANPPLKIRIFQRHRFRCDRLVPEVA
jgi:hypothetical protein